MQVGLLDNISEHLDVIQTFQLMLHRKRGRLGPVHSAALTAAPAATDGPATAVGAGIYRLQHLSTSAGHSDSMNALSEAASTEGVPSSCQHTLGIEPDYSEPSVLTVVHVLHPNEPAKPPAASSSAVAGGSRGAAAGPQGQAGSRPGSSGVVADGSSRPGSSGVLSKWSAGRAAAAASGMDSIDSLDAGEVLEMLLLVSHVCIGQDLMYVV